jgi:tRNA dimethylallyltransferase
VPEVFAVFGPTASGKTAVAEALADRLGTEVVSTDAMQVYRGLALLTNQPERPTRLVAIRALHEEMSVGEFSRLAHEAVDQLVAGRGTAVVAGGTGLYLRAALCDLQVPPRAAAGRREQLESEYDAGSGDAYDRLVRLDPAAAASVHPNDRRRVIRALELAELGASLVPEEDRLWHGPMRRPTLVAGLEVPAGELERRIAVRTARMFENGVVEEVRKALAGPISKTAAKTLGLDEIASLPAHEAQERIVVRTRQYAAYQRKWMRRIPGIVLLDGTRSPSEVTDAILEVARAR